MALMAVRGCGGDHAQCLQGKPIEAVPLHHNDDMTCAKRPCADMMCRPAGLYSNSVRPTHDMEFILIIVHSVTVLIVYCVLLKDVAHMLQTDASWGYC